MSNNDFETSSSRVSSQLLEAADRLWATGMFEDYGDKERDKFAIRARGFPRPEGACLWLEAVEDADLPAVSVVAVRCRAERRLPGGTVTCIVEGRQYTLIPDTAFWDWEEQPDGTYVTLTFSNFGVPETREAFAAMIEHESPVLIHMQGEGEVVEFTVDEVELQWLRDVWTIYRACGGAW
jgi:hypothetical protein